MCGGKSMSFFDDLDSFFVTGDIFYPDNKKRKERIKSLEKDCTNFLALAKKEAEASQEFMENLNNKVKNLLNAKDEIPQYLEITFPKQIEETPYESMMNIYATLCMVPLIQITWKTAYAIINHQSVEEFAKDLSVSLGITAATITGALYFGGIAALFVPGPINGAYSRTNLRKAIKNTANSRKKIYRQYYITEMFNRHLEIVLKRLNAYENTGIQNETIANAIVDKVNLFKNSILDEKTIEIEVEKYLNEKDKQEYQWTQEG